MLTPKDAALLRGLPLLREAAPAAVSEAARHCSVVVLKRGETFAPDGQRRAWFDVAGLLELTLNADGGAAMLDVLRPGDVFGCLDSETPPARPFHVRALGPARLIAMPRADYLRLLRRSPPFARALLAALADRLSESQSLRALAAAPARARLPRILLWLCDKLGPDIPLTRRALAEAAGVTTETAIRLLSPLEKSGVIRTRRGVVTVRDARRLSELALD
ncbi:MAG: Crp/Fnr family transcriptional regulator [Elusimicrobia bacterium]|nr:Crp/Fnr family transcriptional regulator [Elusimicrobiota bacterium]